MLRDDAIVSQEACDADYNDGFHVRVDETVKAEAAGYPGEDGISVSYSVSHMLVRVRGKEKAFAVRVRVPTLPTSRHAIRDKKRASDSGRQVVLRILGSRQRQIIRSHGSNGR